MSNVSQLRKYWQPFLILVAIVIALWLMVVSMAVLIPFLVGILLAYLLMPLVTWFEGILPSKGKAQKAKRVISIVILFIIITLLLILFTAYIGSALASASNVLILKAPEFLTMSANQITDWVKNFKGSVPQTLALQIGSFIDNLGPAAGKFIQDFVMGSVALIPGSVPTIIGFMIMPFFLFFILMDYESFQKYFYDILPPNAAKHAGNILSIIANAMGRYLRSQIILGLIAGTMVFLGLLALRIDYAPALAAVTAITQFIPIVGPVISGLDNCHHYTGACAGQDSMGTAGFCCRAGIIEHRFCQLDTGQIHADPPGNRHGPAGGRRIRGRVLGYDPGPAGGSHYLGDI